MIWKYLKAAFWATYSVPALGYIPVNALLVFAFFLLGLAELIRYGHAGIWLLGLGLEVFYLFTLTFNARFQKTVEAQEQSKKQGEYHQKREILIAKLDHLGQHRLQQLQKKIDKAISLQTEEQNSRNWQLLNKLAWLHLKLLLAQQNLRTILDTNTEKQIEQQLAVLTEELKQNLSDKIRDSKEATLHLLTQRLANFKQKQEDLATINSDLTRIETEVSLLLEQSGVGLTAAAISQSINETSALLAAHHEVYGEAEADILEIDRVFDNI
jgi:hypothetical protein